MVDGRFFQSLQLVFANFEPLTTEFYVFYGVTFYKEYVFIPLPTTLCKSHPSLYFYNVKHSMACINSSNPYFKERYLKVEIDLNLIDRTVARRFNFKPLLTECRILK